MNPTWKSQECPRAPRSPHPGRTQRRLNPLHFPKVVEYLEIVHHRVRVQDRVYGRVHFILKCEDIPPNFPMRVFHHTYVEST